MKKGEAFVLKITTILVEQKIVSENEAKTLRNLFARSEQDYFDNFLIEEGLINDSDLLNALAQYYQVPFFDVVSHFFDRHNLIKFPKDVLLRNAMIPLEDDENTLVMVASNPEDSNLLMEIGQYVSYDVQFRVGLRRDICDAVKEFYDEALTEGMADDLYDDPAEPLTITHEKIEQAEVRDEEFVHDQQEDELR